MLRVYLGSVHKQISILYIIKKQAFTNHHHPLLITGDRIDSIERRCTFFQDFWKFKSRAVDFM